MNIDILKNRRHTSEMGARHERNTLYNENVDENETKI